MKPRKVIPWRRRAARRTSGYKQYLLPMLTEIAEVTQEAVQRVQLWQLRADEVEVLDLPSGSASA